MKLTQNLLCVLFMCSIAVEAMLYSAAVTDCTCVKDCTGEADGLYQSCTKCDQYVGCANEVLTTHSCNGVGFWNDNTKSCDANGSPTCAEKGVYTSSDGAKCWFTYHQCNKALYLYEFNKWLNCEQWCICRGSLTGACINQGPGYTCSGNPAWQCNCSGTWVGFLPVYCGVPLL